MARTRSWTRAGSPDTMRGGIRTSSRQGAGHAILATVRPPVGLAVRHRRRPRPPLRPAPPRPLLWRALRPRPPHGHVLVPTRRHHRRLPPRLRRPLGRRPARRGPRASPALLRRRPLARVEPGSLLALRHRRYADAALRAVRPGRRRPSQPQPGASRREVPLRPRLGHPGLGGAAPAVGHVVSAVARLALRP